MAFPLSCDFPSLCVLDFKYSFAEGSQSASVCIFNGLILNRRGKVLFIFDKHFSVGSKALCRGSRAETERRPTRTVAKAAGNGSLSVCASKCFSVCVCVCVCVCV